MKINSTLVIVLIVSVVVGLATWFVRPAHTQVPFTYEVPVRVTTQTVDTVSFHTKRCNNTGSPLSVSVTAFWESKNGEFIPVQPAGAGVSQIAPGCLARGGDPVNTSYLPNGTWRLRGSVCYDKFCGGYYTDYFEVQR